MTKRPEKQDEYRLQKRHQGWYYVRAVPADLAPTDKQPGRLAGDNGTPLHKIVVSLHTASLPEARLKRTTQDHRWDQIIERARRGMSLTPDEINRAAHEVYAATLDRLAADARRRKSEAGIQIEDIWIELCVFGEVPLEQTALIDATFPIDGLASFDCVADDIAATLRRENVSNPDANTQATLGKAIARAKVAAFQERLRRLRGDEPTEPPQSFLGAAAAATVTLQPVTRPQRPAVNYGDHKGFAEIGDRFLDEIQRDPDSQLTEGARRQYANAFRLFADYAKNAPLATIDRKMAAGFLDTIAKLDPKWGQHPKAKGWPLSELLAKFGNGEQQLSNAALNHYVSSLKSLFDWAEKRGEFEGNNPFAEQSRSASKDGWKPYDTDELNKLFGSKLFTQTIPDARLRPAKHNAETTLLWVPLVALFGGMRLEEICQLETGDVKHDAIGGWYFNVTSEGEGQRLKSEAAKRRVPMHPELIRCGFLQYLKALPSGALWPGLKRGGPDKKLSFYFSKRFTAYRRSVKIERPRTSFHSLRKNFTTALDEAGVYQADAAMLLGHVRGFTFDTYSGGKGLATLRGIVEQIKYDGLNLDHLHVE